MRWIRALEKPVRTESTGMGTSEVEADPYPDDVSISDLTGLDTKRMVSELRLCSMKLDSITEL